MLTITSINNGNFYSRLKSQDLPKAKENISSFAYKDNVSFKGKNVLKQKNTFLSSLLLPVASLTTKYNEYKAHKTLVKEAEDYFFQAREEKAPKDFVDAYVKNPKLAKELCSLKRTAFSYEYSPKTILPIVNLNSENPNIAYNLALMLRGYTSIVPEDFDIIIKKLKTNPELVEQLKKTCVSDTAEVLRAYDLDPEYVSKAHKYVKSDNLLGLIVLRSNYKEEVDKLTIRNDIKIQPTDVLKICSEYNYKDNEEKIEKFFSLTKGEDGFEILDAYLKYPDSFVELYVKDADISNADFTKVCKAHSESKKYFTMAQNSHDKAFKYLFKLDYYSKIADFALGAKEAEPIFKKLKEINPEFNEEADFPLLLKFIENYNKDDNKQNFKQMVEDGRCSNITEMLDLLELYNPREGVVSDKQFDCYKIDSKLSKLFNLQ